MDKEEFQTLAFDLKPKSCITVCAPCSCESTGTRIAYVCERNKKLSTFKFNFPLEIGKLPPGGRYEAQQLDGNTVVTCSEKISLECHQNHDFYSRRSEA